MVVKMLLSHWLWRQQKNDEEVKFARGKIFEMQLRKGLMVKRHFLHVEEKEYPKKENENAFNLNRASKGQRAPKLLFLPCHFVNLRKEVSTMVQLTEIRFLIYKCGEQKTGQTQSLFWIPGRALLRVSPSTSVLQTTWNSFQHFQQSLAHQHQLYRELGGSSPTKSSRRDNTQEEPSSWAKSCPCFQKNLLEATMHLGRSGDHISALDFRHTLWQPAADMPGTSFRKSHFLQRRPLCSVVVAFVSSFSWLLCLEVV